MQKELIFRNLDHVRFYENKVSNNDFTSKELALIYVLGLTDITREHFEDIYSAKNEHFESIIQADWQSEDSLRVTLVAINLYNNYMFGMEGITASKPILLNDDDLKKIQDINSISNIFTNPNLREFFLQAIDLRLG